jgi:hypothetical protein
VNDTFSFHAPAEVFRRRLDPRWIRRGVALVLVLAVVGSFARWVVTSERAADERRDAALAELHRPVASVAASPVVLDDEAARAAASSTLTIARDLFSVSGSFADAATAALSAEEPGLIFVDGPSTAPAIVSVEARGHAWAAAVMGEAGSCFWVKATSDGLIRYGLGTACTGAAAMAADRTAW